jgi:hypothetical protein
MAPAVLGSRNGLRLELDASGRLEHAQDGMPTWRAVLTGRGLNVELQFAEADWEPQGLADFLAGVAADWRGWTGDRTWRSAEAEVRLSLRHEKANTVLVRVELEDGAPPHWRCEAELEVDPGVLEQLASDVRQAVP